VRFLLAMAFGLGILGAGALVCYVAGIYFDRRLHSFMSDAEYANSLKHPIGTRIEAGFLGLVMCALILGIIFLVGAPFAGLLR